MIEIKSLSKKYQNETAINYRDFVFETGKTYMLLGASGCGKSTLLNMIAGILSPSSGQIIIDGNDISGLSQKEKDKIRIKSIGYIFQDFKLIEDMTVRDNIDILKIEGIDTAAKNVLMQALGIYDQRNKKISHLSGGQKQRVAIVRALVKSPDIILADEPTGNLNYEVGEKVVEELIKAAEGKTLIAVTHDDRLSEFFDFTLDMKDLIF